MELLPCLEIEPAQPANATIIWLHGLGANGNDFEPIVTELSLKNSLAVRFVFPHAPEIPVTINGGFIMPAWYDIYEMALDARIDVAGIKRSTESIHKLIEREEERAVSSERIVLLGFSQGGAVAYDSGLTYPKQLAGIMGLSTYFATHDTVAPNKANRDTPIAIHHGLYDHVVPEVLGREAQQYFATLGNPVEYKSYEMDHTLCAQQIGDIADWLNRVLA